MNLNKKIQHIIEHALILLVSSGLLVSGAFAYVASSTNYRLQSDSINIGGVRSTSTGYVAEDTLGEVATGLSGSASYNIKAGYQQMQETYLAISSSGNISLAPAIPSAGGGVSNGQSTWTITTDNLAGYSLSIQASGTPALQSGVNNFANYTPATADPDYNFSVLSTAAEFGFTPEGTDIAQAYRDNGAACNTGSGDTTDRCWGPLLTTPQTIATRSTPNAPSGTTVTIKFRAESGSSNVQPAGTYTATSTLQLIAL